MKRDALEFVTELRDANEHYIGEQVYSDKQLYHVRQPTAETLVVRNLSALVDYVKQDFDAHHPFLIHVASPTRVHVFDTYNRDMDRNEYVRAEAMLPDIPFGYFRDTEEFNILLQSCFVDNPGRESVLSVVGNIVEENVMSFGDDGVSQAVTAKSGIAQRENVVVPNPVSLKPFRTFVEIPQPESSFIFRMQKGPVAALFEADGGAWKLDAIASIRNYLAEQLLEEIEASKAILIG